MRFRLRTLLIATGSFLIALGAILWADRTFYTTLQMWPANIPLIVKWLLAPGGAVAFTILGDAGSEGQNRLVVIAASTAFYSVILFVTAMVADRRGRQPATLNHG